MRPIKIAQIGASETTHAAVVFQTMAAHPEEFDIVGYADVDRHTHPRSSAYAGYPCLSVEEILNMDGLDAVAVECDEVLQTRYAIMAAERGLAIHLEKPGSESDEDFDHLIDLAQEKNLPFHTGYMYRYNPCVLHALDAVRGGRLGKIYSVEALMNCYHTPDMRQWFSTFRGGMMYYLGCHLVDLILQIQGVPREIIPLNTSVEPEQFPGNDFGMALFRYECGTSLAKASAVEPGGYLRRQLVICGTRGTIEIKPFEIPTGASMVISTDMTEWYLPEGKTSFSWEDEGIHTHTEPFNRYEAMMRSFAAIVRGEKKNPWSSEYERLLHKCVLAACGFPQKLER